MRRWTVIKDPEGFNVMYLKHCDIKIEIEKIVESLDNYSMWLDGHFVFKLEKPENIIEGDF